MNRISRLLYAPCLALFLALAFAEGARAQQGVDYKALGVQFLATHEPLLQEEKDTGKRLHLLLNLTPAAMYAGDAQKATAYAQELLALGEQAQTRPGFGPGLYADATHVGNVVLGRLALQGGDVGKAKGHLLASARVPVTGSPVLGSFGPSMILAEELLEKGERDAVVEYFDLCKQFWKNEGGKLERWKAVVKDGDIPNFGPHIGTQIMSWRFAK